MMIEAVDLILTLTLTLTLTLAYSSPNPNPNLLLSEPEWITDVDHRVNLALEWITNVDYRVHQSTVRVDHRCIPQSTSI